MAAKFFLGRGLYYNLGNINIKRNNRHFYGLFNFIFWWNNNYWPTPLKILCKNKKKYIIDNINKIKKLI
jgi:hypothetical protein